MRTHKYTNPPTTNPIQSTPFHTTQKHKTTAGAVCITVPPSCPLPLPLGTRSRSGSGQPQTWVQASWKPSWKKWHRSPRSAWEGGCERDHTDRKTVWVVFSSILSPSWQNRVGKANLHAFGSLTSSCHRVTWLSTVCVDRTLVVSKLKYGHGQSIVRLWLAALVWSACFERRSPKTQSVPPAVINCPHHRHQHIQPRVIVARNSKSLIHFRITNPEK